MLSFIILFENSWILDLFWFWDSIFCSIIDFYTLFMTYTISNENIYITLLTKKWWLLLKKKTKLMRQISFLSWWKYLVVIHSLKLTSCILWNWHWQHFWFYFQKDVFLTKYDVFYAVTDFPHHLYIKMINLLSCTSCAIVL